MGWETKKEKCIIKSHTFGILGWLLGGRQGNRLCVNYCLIWSRWHRLCWTELFPFGWEWSRVQHSEGKAAPLKPLLSLSDVTLPAMEVSADTMDASTSQGVLIRPQTWSRDRATTGKHGKLFYKPTFTNWFQSWGAITIKKIICCSEEGRARQWFKDNLSHH